MLLEAIQIDHSNLTNGQQYKLIKLLILLINNFINKIKLTFKIEHKVDSLM